MHELQVQRLALLFFLFFDGGQEELSGLIVLRVLALQGIIVLEVLVFRVLALQGIIVLEVLVFGLLF